MARTDRHTARCRALVQHHVPERVLAAGAVSAVDAAAAAAAPHGPGGGFPPRAWIGVTAHRVYAFAAEHDEVGALIGVWDRTDLTVTKAPRLAATRLSLRFGGAGTVDLDAPRRSAGSRELVRYLLDPTRDGSG